MEKPTLVSLDICPYVLRAVAYMFYRNLDYNIEYIDISNKPEWFLKISPFGKVPVLKIGDQEYMDEVNSPSIQPTDPIKKALNKGYYTLSTDFLVSLRNIFIAKDENSYQEAVKNNQALLQKLENLLPAEGPFFNGKDIALIDFTFSPVFVQLDHLQKHGQFDALKDTPKVRAYSQAITSLESVKKAQVPNFDEIYYKRVSAYNPYYQTIVKA